jgi:hypothetical protein
VPGQKKRTWSEEDARTRAWRSRTNRAKAGSLEFGRSTSAAVITALTRSRFTTMARSRPRIVDGYESSESSTRRSRAGSPVRAITACFPASSTRAGPDAGTTIQSRLAAAAAAPAFRLPTAPPPVPTACGLILYPGLGFRSVSAAAEGNSDSGTDGGCPRAVRWRSALRVFAEKGKS